MLELQEGFGYSLAGEAVSGGSGVFDTLLFLERCRYSRAAPFFAFLYTWTNTATFEHQKKTEKKTESSSQSL